MSKNNWKNLKKKEITAQDFKKSITSTEKVLKASAMATTTGEAEISF